MKDKYTKPLNSSHMQKLTFRSILIIITLSVVSELLITAVLESFSIHNVYLNGYLDTILLLILLTSLLYFLVIRPMNFYIEESNKAKEALFESKEHYRALTDSGDALIWKTGTDGKCAYVNQTWLNFTGRTLEQETGYGWMEGMHPEDAQLTFPVYQLALKEKDKFSVKYRMRHRSGEYRWIQSNGNPTFNSKGEFTGYIGHCLDIHESKMAEEYIRKREHDYRTLFEYSPIAALFLDRQGTIIFWNKAAEKTLGWTKEETIGKNLTLFFKPDYNKPEINYNVDETIDKYKNEIITKEYLKPDGTTIICEWYRTPIYDMGGKTQKVILMVKDISEQKQLEEQLMAAKEKAEESERLKSAFLANMSHELRSPLNSIIGFSELLSDPDFDELQKEQFAQLINSGGKHLLETITELMDFSKLDAGQVKVNKQSISLTALLKDLQLEYSFKAAEKGISLVLDRDNPRHDIIVNTDHIKLRQVLINYISNALKFTTKGNIQLGMKITGTMVQLHVRDTGMGIPREYQDKIFQRFLQVEAPGSIKMGGIGLGLAISKNLIELLGGTTWVESQEGVGSTFYFTLPLYENANPELPAGKTTDQPDNIKRMTI